MRLWEVSTGKCLFVWEFPTAVKRITFNEEDDQIVCITEQRMGYQGAIRVFDINREGDGRNRACCTRPRTRIRLRARCIFHVSVCGPTRARLRRRLRSGRRTTCRK
jgi:hypothetical protein